MRRHPGVHRGNLSGPIVMVDRMKLEVLGRFFIDLLEHGQLVLMLGLTLDAADQFPLGKS